MIKINWDDSEDRAELVERIGVEAYNKAYKEYIHESTVATVGGHAIRPVGTMFGKLYQVGNTGRAFSTLEEAKAYAKTNKKQKATNL